MTANSETTEVRHFTVDEANATLPLVRRIVQDIVHDYAEWKSLVRRFEILMGDAVPGDKPPDETPEQTEVRTSIEQLAERINGYVSELTAIGCVCKGFDEGLVDFVGIKDGREVWLCWILGEPEVAHWHELDAGFAGRQPIVPEEWASDEVV